MLLLVQAAGAAQAASSSPPSSNTLALVAIVVSGLVAIASPIVAGIFLSRSTARMIAAEGRRQTKALEEERARLAAAFEAEDRRHREQLAFERGETDRAELRTILDALAEHLHAVVDVIQRAAVLADQWRDDGDPTGFRHARLDELGERIASSHDALTRDIERVRLRLGSGAERLLLFAQMVRQEGSLLRWTGPEFDRAALARLATRLTAVEELLAAFRKEALRFTRAELHERPQDESPQP